jgi:hypothetical protein
MRSVRSSILDALGPGARRVAAPAGVCGDGLRASKRVCAAASTRAPYIALSWREAACRSESTRTHRAASLPAHLEAIINCNFLRVPSCSCPGSQGALVCGGLGPALAHQSMHGRHPGSSQSPAPLRPVRVH